MNSETDQEKDYKQYLADLKITVKTPEGARVICMLLENLGAFEPCWSEKNPRLARAAVLKDFGQNILDDLATTDEKTHDDIQRMMRTRRRLSDSLITSNNAEEDNHDNFR